MSLGRQAKILSKQQVAAALSYLTCGRNALRNQVIFLLSVRAGLRAKEIASLRWVMLTAADGAMAAEISLPDAASKGRSGRTIPLNRTLRDRLAELMALEQPSNSQQAYVIKTSRKGSMSPQMIVNLFAHWYRSLGFHGCSSHSGRRTFITNAAKKIGTVGGSLRDVQMLAGHSSLQLTQRYIESDSEAQRRIVNLE